MTLLPDATRGADPVRDGRVVVPGATRLLVVGGRDRLRFLHAVTTQDLQGLGPGQGAYGAVTDDRGHPLGDFHLYVLPHAVLLEVGAARAELLRAALERLIVADDVVLAWADGIVESVEAGDPARVAQAVGRPAEHLTDVTPGVSWSQEPAPAEAAAAEEGDERALAGLPLAMGVVARRSQWGGYGAFRMASRGAARTADDPTGPEVLDSSVLDALEIAAGRVGDAELTEARVLSELGITGAVSFAKGCFPGQEILNRVRARGELKRKLVGIVLEAKGEGVRAGSALETPDGRPAGRITRVAGTRALAFVGREWWTPGTPLRAVSPPGGGIGARVAALPLVERRPAGNPRPPFLPVEVD